MTDTQTGVTPRQAAEHIKKGGTVETFDSYRGIWAPVCALSNFLGRCKGNTPRPQWRLVPLPEPEYVSVQIPVNFAKWRANQGPAVHGEWVKVDANCRTAIEEAGVPF